MRLFFQIELIFEKPLFQIGLHDIVLSDSLQTRVIEREVEYDRYGHHKSPDDDIGIKLGYSVFCSVEIGNGVGVWVKDNI